ncbi:hypothetical protein LguiA_030726 [Lonicera macranthoides]
MGSRVLNSVYAHPPMFLIVTLLCLALATANHGGNETDSLALLAFKSNLHDPQGVLNSWNHSVHFCNWQGVTCGRLHRRVTFLNLSSSGLSGSLSPYIGNLSFLKQLALYNNSFSGEIPIEIGQLFRLRSLLLLNNSIEGKIPANLSQCTSLEVFNVVNNKLVGEMIPRELIISNNLGGTIPKSVGNLSTQLTDFGVEDNRISGSIPSGFGNLVNLERLQMGFNMLEGKIPNDIGMLQKLQGLHLPTNQLSGTIPISLGNISLVNLSLGGNFFRGSIPLSLNSLRGLENLDLSNNNLSGALPIFLENFPLKSLNLSFNDFEGELPTRGVFANALSISVLGNSGLCGGISELRLPRCRNTTSNRRRLSRLHIIIISVSCLILSVSIVLLFIFCWRKSKRRLLSSQSLVKESLLKVSYGDLFKATNGFSSTNIIGTGSFGSVYKGTFDRGEMVAAVKVLNLQRYGASKSFMAECKALRNIRHRNLVKIITSCSSIDFGGNDFKALVYEFMPNGSLERWLHSNQENLNLHQRISVAIDVAFALDYLHHESGKPVIHCDLKPSNILLDVDMVAHVGDFGLAKFSTPESENANQSQSVGVKGTIGYAAPDARGFVQSRQVVSGARVGPDPKTSSSRRSLGFLRGSRIGVSTPMFSDGLNVHNYAKVALLCNVTKILEPKLLGNDEEDVEQAVATNMQINSRESSTNDNKMGDCIVSVVKIGVACSMESPQGRMDLNEVIRQLQSIKSAVKDIYHVPSL